MASLPLGGPRNANINTLQSTIDITIDNVICRRLVRGAAEHDY